MHRLVVEIALRQEVPLGAGVQNPEHGHQDRSCRIGFAAGAAVREMLFRKVLLDPFPPIIAQAKHDRPHGDGSSSRQLF